MAQTLVRSDLSDRPDSADPATGGQQPLVNVNGTQTDRLIQRYTEAAGSLGPRKLFAGAKFVTLVSIGEYYDDNIVSSLSARDRGDFVTTLTGGLTLVLGDVVERRNSFLLASYTGTGNLFARYGSENSYDQDALLDVRWRRPMFQTELTGRFQDLHDASADLGQREGRRLYNADGLAKYFLTDRTTLLGSVDLAHDDYDTGVGTTDVKGGLAGEYAVSAKIALGAEAVLGHLEVGDGVEEWYEQGRVRVSYAPDDKLALDGWLGVEVRERGGQAGTSATPVFSATGKWTPYTGTTLSLRASRQVFASGADAGDDFIDTGVQANAHQEIAKRFFLDLGVGYDHLDYRQVARSGFGPRADDYYLLRASGGYSFVDWFRLLVFYERRQNESTRADYSFESNRWGTTAALLF